MDDIFEKLDKTKFYCNKCLKLGIISELNFDKEDERYLEFPDCEHKNSRPFYKIYWDNKNKKWTCS